MEREYLEARIRQLPLHGRGGQKDLHDCRLVVIGCGGNGATVLLAASLVGFREIYAVDQDVLNPPNLHRFVLGGYANVGEPKAEICAAALHEMDPTITVSAIVDWLESAKGMEAMERADAVVLCVDRNEPRLLASRCCVPRRTPLLDLGTGGQLVRGRLRMLGCRVSFYAPPHGACLRCIYLGAEPMPQSRISWLPLNLMAVSLGLDMLVAHLTGYRKLTANHILFDALTGELDQMMVGRREDCPFCGSGANAERVGNDRSRERTGT